VQRFPYWHAVSRNTSTSRAVKAWVDVMFGNFGRNFRRHPP
jgi:hypothetical protein